MEVRPGYKHSELGVIPQDWGVQPFASLFNLKNGVNGDKSAYGKGIPFINVLEPITYSHIHGPEIPGRVTLPDSTIASYLVKRGDILFNRTSETDAELGMAATYVGTEPVVFGGFVIRARPINGALDPTYSGYALRARVIRSQIVPMGQGVVRANIGQQNLMRVLAPVPPLPEQQAIATALSDVDALLGSLERLIAKKRDLKQAAMQQLLTGESRLPGFGGAWAEVPLASICKMKSGEGITHARIDLHSQYPCYGGNGLRGFTTTYTHEGRHALIGRQGALCGNVFGVEGRFFASEHAIVVTALPQIDIRWLTCVLDRMNLNQYSESSAQPGLSVSKLLILGVQVPPTKTEQAAIAAVLSDFDAEIAALEQRSERTRALKQAMMQELLTGRTRLVVPDATSPMAIQLSES